MNKFWQFLQNEDGKFSSMRLGFLIAIVPVMVVWTILSLKKAQLIDVPMGVYSLVGILATGKVSQIWVNKRYHKKKTRTKPQEDGLFATIWNFIKKYIPFLRHK